MALSSLTAKANTGGGTDTLATVDTASGKAGAVALVTDSGVLVDGANPVPVAVQGSVPLPSGAASEATAATLSANIGNAADAEASGDGTVIGVLKRLRTLLARGAAVMASSLSVTIATDQTDIPTIAKAPAPLLTTYSLAGVIPINTVLVTLDCSQYRSVSIQCVSMGTTGVVTPEWSNNNATWAAASMQSAASAAAATFNAAGVFTLSVKARYLRLRLSTATTAGTTTLSIYQFNDRIQEWLTLQQVTGTVTATVSGAGITGGTISPLTVAGVSVEASSAKTASGNSAAAITNASARGAAFIVNVSAVSGTTPTLAVKLQVQDTVSLAWVDVPGAVTATISSVSAVMLTVYPGIVEAANTKVSFPLPRTYRLAWTIGGTTPSFTFSVSAQYVI